MTTPSLGTRLLTAAEVSEILRGPALDGLRARAAAPSRS